MLALNPAGIACLGRDGRVLSANAALVRLLGYASAEALAACADPLRQHATHPEQIEALFADAASGGTVAAHVVAWRRVDGTEIWVSLSLRLDGDAYLLAATDVSPLIRLQQQLVDTQMALYDERQRLRDAINSLDDGFTIWDAQDRLVAVNSAIVKEAPRLADLLQPGRAYEEVIRALVGEGFLRQLPTDPDYCEGEAFVQLHLRRFRDFDIPVRTVGPDGRVWEIHRTPTPEGGRVMVWRDITDTVQVEAHQAEAAARLAALAEERDRERQRAEAASHAKSQFLMNMSHELRTPLNAVIGFSEVLVHRMFGPLGDPRYGEYAESIQRAGRHLLSLISDLLDIAQIELGGWRPEKVSTDVAAVIGDVVEMVAPLAREARLSLLVDPPQTCIGLFDPRALRQILLHLLTHAIRRTPADGVITFRAGCVGDDIVIDVSDTSAGLTAEELALLDSPLDPIQEVTIANQRNLTLGLAIAKTIVQLHGGTLTVRSEPGLGTSVRCVFPA